MAWVAKVNRHVAVLTTINGRLKRRPGVITGFATDTNPIIRVGRHDIDDVTPGDQYETYGNATNGVPRRTNPDEDWTVNKYVSY